MNMRDDIDPVLSKLLGELEGPSPSPGYFEELDALIARTPQGAGDEPAQRDGNRRREPLPRPRRRHRLGMRSVERRRKEQLGGHRRADQQLLARAAALADVSQEVPVGREQAAVELHMLTAPVEQAVEGLRPRLLEELQRVDIAHGRLMAEARTAERRLAALKAESSQARRLERQFARSHPEGLSLVPHVIQKSLMTLLVICEVVIVATALKDYYSLVSSAFIAVGLGIAVMTVSALLGVAVGTAFSRRSGSNQVMKIQVTSAVVTLLALVILVVQPNAALAVAQIPVLMGAAWLASEFLHPVGVLGDRLAHSRKATDRRLEKAMRDLVEAQTGLGEVEVERGHIVRMHEAKSRRLLAFADEVTATYLVARLRSDPHLDVEALARVEAIARLGTMSKIWPLEVSGDSELQAFSSLDWPSARGLSS